MKAPNDLEIGKLYMMYKAVSGNVVVRIVDIDTDMEIRETRFIIALRDIIDFMQKEDEDYRPRMNT